MDWYRSLMDSMIHGHIIPRMRQENIAFRHLYKTTSLVGSSSVGLKVKTTKHEFDLDVIFRIDERLLKIVDLGDESGKANFCRIRVMKQVSMMSDEY